MTDTDDTLGENELVAVARRAWQEATADYPGNHLWFDGFKKELLPNGLYCAGDPIAYCRICRQSLEPMRFSVTFAETEARSARNEYHARQCLLRWYAEHGR